MRDWLKARWEEYRASYDVDEVLSGSTPMGILIAVGGLSAVLATLGFAPYFAQASQFRHPEVAILLALAAGANTLLAWKYRCRGVLGTLGTLLDNPLYSSSLAFAAVNTQGGYGVGLAVVHAIMVLVFPAHYYGLTPIFALVMSAPPLALVGLYQPPAPVAIVLVCSTIMLVAVSYLTHLRHRLVQRQQRLELALGAADKIADESMQAALATTLVSLGHFLHELRNHQTSISTNLAYLELTTSLGEDARRALADAQQAQREQEDLVRQTVDELKKGARPLTETFRLDLEIEQLVEEVTGLRVRVNNSTLGFLLTGRRDHLRHVLLNLSRNAAQAGARHLLVELQLDPSAESAQLLVHDDGPGISEAHCTALFEPFAASTKPGGTGLGLYLCRRYVELLGGRIAAGTGPLGGASFTIRLPGRVVAKTSGLAPAPGDSSVAITA